MSPLVLAYSSKEKLLSAGFAYAILKVQSPSPIAVKVKISSPKPVPNPLSSEVVIKPVVISRILLQSCLSINQENPVDPFEEATLRFSSSPYLLK